jgi:uncharacterized protein YdeI (YjbR/CyaY-like superfamily)
MSPKPVFKSFSAVLERSGNSLNWTHIVIPFDSVKAWGARGVLRVKGDINGFAFRTSLFPTGDGRHTMPVNKQMQKGGRATPGMAATFRLGPDLEERVVSIPSEFQRILKSSRRLEKFFQSLAPSIRKFILESVAQGKQRETRLRRAEQAGEHLMEVMEAEIELPPLLRQAFARNPQAARGWDRLSRAHQRRHLFYILHGHHDARLRRIERAMTEMIRYAERPLSGPERQEQ